MNFSSKPLTELCTAALSKGLSFAPTTTTNDFETVIDFEKFFRKLRLRELFHNTPSNTLHPPTTNESTPTSIPEASTSAPEASSSVSGKGLLRPKSTFIPPRNRNASLDTYCRLVEHDVKTALKSKRQYKVYNNMPKSEREALAELNNDRTVVIRPADKGGALILQNTIDYEKEIHRQLGDSNFYTRLPSDPTTKYMSIVHDKLQTWLDKGEINKQEFGFMKNDFPVIPVFYTLPKVHKSQTPPLPGRPIVSGIGSLTANVSTFVDHCIKPIVCSLPSYIRDSIDFINKLKTMTLPNSDILLATFDVSSLYTNIPHDGGIEAMKHFLDQRTNACRPQTECILDLAHVVLTSNFFLFKEEYYLQIKGTAMGSTMAPNYANLYMGFFENNFVLNSEVNPYFNNVLLYQRFIDDVFILWKGDERSLRLFHQYLNSVNDHLSFTLDFDQSQISFLDVLVIRDGANLQTDLFRKPTDRNTILRGDSYHPSHLIKSLPISQFHRARRICSSDQRYASQASDLSQRFQERGYKQQWVDAASERFAHVTQDECLIPKSGRAQKQNSTLCITKYSPLGSEFKKIIRKHWHVVETDPKLKGIFTAPPTVVFRRAPNLRDKLVKSHTHESRQNPFNIPDGNYKCGNCAQCGYTMRSRTYTHPHTGKTLNIRGVINCNTPFVVYLLKCPCGLAYVGKTSRPLRTRISEHRSNIRCGDTRNPVAAHFLAAGHNVCTLRYTGIERVERPPRGGNHDRLLLQRETYHIYALNTMSPHGLNEDFDIKPFL